MLDKKEFESIRKDLKEYEEKRENLIRKSRDVIRLSKLAIYSCQRNEFKEAEEALSQIKVLVKEIPAESYDTDIGSVAIQEYVEAACLYEFMKSGKIASRKSLSVDAEHYLLGLCDLTGELVRQAINDVINKKTEHAMKIRELVNDIYGEFLKLDLRNGELRKKADSIKWNLKKLEELALDVAAGRHH